jgi:acyl-CoA synthetase (AMP-forming)/AMP-acid ligase II
LASVGPAFTGVEVRVADAEDNPLPPDEIGEILVRGDTVMAGYWNNPAASAETLRNGWLHTGDVGSMDADGFLTLKDRSKDVIISGGSNIYPREVEEVLLRHPAVSEVSVVGQADAEWGEIVIAFVVPRGAGTRHRGARRPVPRPHRPLQAAQALRDGRCAAQEQYRQGAEDRPARTAGLTARQRPETPCRRRRLLKARLPEI